MKKFVIQRLIEKQQVEGSELCTWRTVSEPTSEEMAFRKLQSMNVMNGRRFRALNSPCAREMASGAEMQEWSR